jgi:hypothetical protein
LRVELRQVIGGLHQDQRSVREDLGECRNGSQCE